MRLFSGYVSQTASIRVAEADICDCKNGIRCFGDLVGFNMCTIAAMSKTLTAAKLIAADLLLTGIPGRHFNIFVPVLYQFVVYHDQL